jgi:hypothetical protein
MRRSFGTCGSFKEADMPVATFVMPKGNIVSFEPPSPDEGVTVPCPNKVECASAKLTRHVNVCTLLQEHDRRAEEWSAEFDTVDMEAFHICRAVGEHGHPVDLRIVMRVSDAVDSKTHGVQSEERLDFRSDGFDTCMDDVILAFGLIDVAV